MNAQFSFLDDCSWGYPVTGELHYEHPALLSWNIFEGEFLEWFDYRRVIILKMLFLLGNQSLKVDRIVDSFQILQDVILRAYFENFYS